MGPEVVFRRMMDGVGGRGWGGEGGGEGVEGLFLLTLHVCLSVCLSVGRYLLSDVLEVSLTVFIVFGIVAMGV